MKEVQVALAEPGRTLIVSTQVNEADYEDYTKKPWEVGVVVVGPDSGRFLYPGERVIGTGDIGFPGQNPSIKLTNSMVVYATYYTWYLPGN
jgi:succinyl-CoA synthetase alpha subunit